MTFSKDKWESLVESIVVEISKISIFPYIYQKIYQDYYSFTIKNQRVIYYVDEENKTIVIYRILWWFQNYQDYL
jgi:plasmid stabilization system protein ParE